MDITTLESLRALYDPARERSIKKQITFLDAHCQRFISLSPILVLGTCSATIQMDTSPRGGAPGFVKVLDEHTPELQSPAVISYVVFCLKKKTTGHVIL